MAELLASTAAITSEIEKLINESNGEKLILVTPYLKIARQFKNNIQDQVKFRTSITVVVREGESHDPADINFLQELKINLHTHQNLHAKCYLIVKNLTYDTKVIPKELGNPCTCKTKHAAVFFESIDDNLFHMIKITNERP